MSQIAFIACFRSPGLSGGWLAAVAGHLGGDLQQVEVLTPHLEEDLALGVELERLLQRLLDLVLAFIAVHVVMNVLVSRSRRHGVVFGSSAAVAPLQQRVSRRHPRTPTESYRLANVSDLGLANRGSIGEAEGRGDRLVGHPTLVDVDPFGHAGIRGGDLRQPCRAICST